ncbi:ribosomal protein S18-alanine N-acetyltransferase [Sanguibacter massiliensis]|uniref:ribosomal protein S18-alanine N-acetyltransferase n=1 Tax=Sanguibacter massiliensis TaxID=1973217 RepID=UPI001F5C4105|nr:ribosomal protein S18-alanine N-acetyltransferase [Sanguibacter massiliensis]
MSEVTPPDDLEMTIDLGARREVVEAAYAEHDAAGTVPEETLEVTPRRARPAVADDSPIAAGYHLRPLAWADITRVAALEVELFGASAWTMGMLTEELRGRGRWYIAAQPDGEGVPAPLVGYAGLWFDGDSCHLMTIGVDPRVAGHGLGGAMLDALIERAREIDAISLLLEVAVDNERAIAMYTSRGFTTIGLRKRYYQPEDVDAYTMQLPLREGAAGS